MKNNWKLVLALFAILLFSGIDLVAQNVSTMGKDFWVSFLPNWPGGVPKMELLITGQTSCSGKVENPYTGWSATFAVTADEVTTVLVPNSECLTATMNKIEHKAVHVTATEDVSVYASNFVTASYDVANVLPTAILKDNYVAQSYMVGFTAVQGTLYSKLLIVAVENNTEVVVNPKGGLAGHFPASSKQTIKLNAGECYLFCSAIGDISGTTVMAKDGKKIAVFSGGDTQIPANSCCYDAVFEQIMPMAYLGRHFVVTASAMRDNDIVRITSVAPGCRVLVDGKYKRTLSKNKSYDIKLNGKKKEAIYISTSSPVMVCLYFTSAGTGGKMGDPSMVNINPIEQQMDKVTFSTYNTQVTTAHFVNIVAQTAHVSGVVLDGDSIASEFKPVPAKKELSYARVSVSHGSHTLESTTGGFVAHVYGLGPYESYSYSVGSNSKVLNEFDDEGNLVFNTIPNELEDLDDPTESVESDEPEPVYVKTDTLPQIVCDTLSLKVLKGGGEVRGVVKGWGDKPEEGIILDVMAESKEDYLLDPIDVNVNADTIVMSIKARNEWCDCFVPSQLDVEVVIVYDNNDDLSRVVIPMTVPVVREKAWLGRCLWVLLTIAGLLLLVLYLWGLLRKRRFKKSARIDYTYMELKGGSIKESELHHGIRLRQKGFIKWVSRWLVPFRDERRSIPWQTPPAGYITFVAGKHHETVNIVRSCFDPNKMRMSTYVPGTKSKLIVMDTIQVFQNNKLAGRLEYCSGHKDDEKVFRLTAGILIVAAVAAIGVLTFLMLKGLL